MSQSNSLVQWSVVQIFFIVSVVFSVMFGVYTPSIIGSLHISLSSFGWLAGMFFIFYAIVQFYSGRLFVKIPSKYILCASALISAGGSLLLATATDLQLLFLARILLGIGLASTYVGVLYIVQKNYSPKSFPVMSSLSQCLANLAGALFVFFGGIIIQLISYAIFFEILAVAFVICGALVFFGLNDTDVQDKKEQDIPLIEGLKIILKNPQVWLASFFFTGIFGTIISFANLFSIPFQHQSFGTAIPQAVMITSMIIFGVTLGSIVSGVMAKRLNSYVITARVFSLFSVISFAIIMFIRFNTTYYEPIALSIYFLLGFSLGGCVLAFQCIQENITQESLRPLATSFVLTFAYIFAGIIEQPIIGLILGVFKPVVSPATTQQLISNHSWILNMHVHDSMYQYMAALSIVLITLIISLISAFFLNKKS
jgi:MFS family permease